MQPKIICHGGALLTRRRTRSRIVGVHVAAGAGYRVLLGGGSALDAVTVAVTALEDAPELNAGTGSFLQLDGRCRMDACIMDSDRRLGAVIQIEGVRNPVQVARRLLDSGAHSILAGAFATEFARGEGFPEYDVRTDAKLRRWLEGRAGTRAQRGRALALHLRAEIRKRNRLGTVGAVAIDRRGRIAAATSTGGMSMNLPGRVGDVALVGCGTYADPVAGVSCTGIGEQIVRVVLAREVAARVEAGDPVQRACEAAIARLGAVGGLGGVIAIDRRGEVGSAFNSADMATCRMG